MPLSDHEQRILDEIEKNLLQEDPGFAKKERVSADDKRKRARLGAFGFLAGLVALLLFFSTSLVIVGVIAFAGMVSGIVLIAGSMRPTAAPGGFFRDSRERAGRFFTEWEDKVNQRRKKE